LSSGGLATSVIVCKGLKIKFIFDSCKKSEVKSLYIFPSETLVRAGEHFPQLTKPDQVTDNSITVYIMSGFFGFIYDICLGSWADKTKKTHTKIMQALAQSAKVAVYYYMCSHYSHT
jgi:hypothetical protein